MINLKIVTSASELPQQWDALVDHNLLLQRLYLKSLEEASPANISNYYLLIYKDSELCGLALVQHVKLYLQDIFRKNTGNGIVKVFRKLVSATMKGNILVVGNLTHTGQHGVYYMPNKLANGEFIEHLLKGLEDISATVKSTENKKIRLHLFKDYFSNIPLIVNESTLNNNRIYKVKVQPNMVLPLNSEWKTIDDYYIDLNKKYKKRFRTARKKLGNIIEVELLDRDVESRSNELHELYRIVSDNAKLNMFYLPENHFSVMKSGLKEKFRVFGFFLDDKLVGFYTLILNNTSLETYFLGYNPDYQYSQQLYLNMLYNMLSFGIENKFKQIVYARTAMEIKSSVGAEAHNMIMYIKHTTPVVNRYLKPIFKLLDPTEDWQRRHPFNN